jgi:uncharacterized protein DUF6636
VLPLLGAAALLVPLPGIRSPSGNIRRFATSNVLHCDIAQSSYAKTLQSRCMTRASLDWHGFELNGAKRGTFVCSGGILYDPDTERPSYADLPYGKSRRLRAFTCTSRVTGVTCTSRAGHGQFLSRESWRAW